MCKADLPAVAQLEKECFAEAWSENALAESLAESNYVFFVAAVSKPSCMEDEKDTEEIAGYVGAYLAADDAYQNADPEVIAKELQAAKAEIEEKTGKKCSLTRIYELKLVAILR